MNRHKSNQQLGIATTPAGAKADWPKDAESLPDLARFIDSVRSLPETQQVASLWEDQRGRWQCGARVGVEEYLRHLREPASAAVICDLIYGEYVLRADLGETPDVAEYVARFPRVAEQLTRQLRLEQAIETADLPNTVAGGSPAARRSDTPIPISIGKFQVVALLDSGGQADVYRAIHPGLQTEVVIKWGKSTLGSLGQDQRRLIFEGRLLAELDHPNLARVLDCDIADGRPFLVMEYVPGRNLEQFATQRPLDPAAAARLVTAVARAVDAAHRRGVVHLDIKPKNIVIDENGTPRLIDFGLARMLDAWRPSDVQDKQGVVGTLQYMAPEQARGDQSRINPASDIFALGAVLHFLLTGLPPRTGTRLHELLREAKAGEWDGAPLQSSSAPMALKRIVRRALDAKLENRFGTAAAFAEALEATNRTAFPHKAVFGLSLAGALLLVSWLVLHSQFDSNPLAGSPAVGPSAPNILHPSPVQIRVWHETRYIELVDALPLQAGDQLQVEAVAPDDLHAVMILLDSDGEFSVLSAVSADAPQRRLRFPDTADQATGITGRGGTDVVLVCGQSSVPINLDELRAAVGRAEPLPTLPKLSLLRISGHRVSVEQRDRSFGPPAALDDPEGNCQRELEAMLQRLINRYIYVEGIAFAHHE